ASRSTSPSAVAPCLSPHARARATDRLRAWEILHKRVETYYETYGVVLAVVIAGVGLVAVALLTARLMSPHRPLPEKLTTYECGIDPVGEGWSQSQIRYYVYAFLFVIFDVESVFLFPWATVFERFAWQAVVEMAVFVFILALGLRYAYRKKVRGWTW